MDLPVNIFDIQTLTTKKCSCLIIGAYKTDKSKVTKDITTSLKNKDGSPYYGIVFTDKHHMNNFYNYMNPARVWKRYSDLNKTRCIQDNMYVIIDYCYSSVYQDFINTDKNMTIMVVSTIYITNIPLDYIVITKIDTSEIEAIYNKHVSKCNITIDDFKLILNVFNEDNIPLILNCNATNYEDLFYEME